MPHYDYDYLDENGNQTGEKFEYFQSMRDDPLTKHPENGRPCQRSIQIPNIISDAMRMDGVARKRVPGDFKEVLHKIHEKTPGSTLNQSKFF